MLHKIEKENDEKTSRHILPPVSSTSVSSSLVVIDSFSILLSGFFSYYFTLKYSSGFNLYLTSICFVWIISIILMHFGGLYRYPVATKPLKYLSGILVATSCTFLFLLAGAFSIKVSDTFSRLWLGTFALSSICSLIGLRILAASLFIRLLRLRAYKRSTAILGTGQQCQQLLASFASGLHHSVHVYGVFSDIESESKFEEFEHLPSSAKRGGVSELMRQTRGGHIDDVIIALPWAEDERIMKILSKLRELPVNVYLATDLIGFRTRFSNPPDHFGAAPLYKVIGKPMSGWDAVIKRCEDYVLALILLAFIWPVLVLIALVNLIDSGRPIFFAQERLGFNNEVFLMWKFRTMHVQEEGTSITIQAKKDDQRVTRFGRILRRWSLDELPQIFNVLNGTMSLVGPRPHALDHNDEFAQRTKDYFSRHRVKPGITGLAQVRGFRGPTDTPEKLEGRIRNDILYAENWTLSLDFQILLRTIAVCLFGKNAY